MASRVAVAGVEIRFESEPCLKNGWSSKDLRSRVSGLGKGSAARGGPALGRACERERHWLTVIGCRLEM